VSATLTKLGSTINEIVGAYGDFKCIIEKGGNFSKLRVHLGFTKATGNLTLTLECRNSEKATGTGTTGATTSSLLDTVNTLNGGDIKVGDVVVDDLSSEEGDILAVVGADELTTSVMINAWDGRDYTIWTGWKPVYKMKDDGTLAAYSFAFSASTEAVFEIPVVSGEYRLKGVLTADDGTVKIGVAKIF
jgi:hypothetical protein